MDSYFEINVARAGVHYFATAPRSLRSKAQAFEALEDLRKRFPPEEHFSVTMTYWECRGHAC